MVRALSPMLAAAWLVGCSQATAPLDLGPSPVGVQVFAQMQYYDVTAESLAELRSGLRQHGPRSGGRPWAAVTNWRMRWTYVYDPRGIAGCEITRVKVRLETTIDFPRWTPATPPDSGLLAWWNQLNEGLTAHERGHALIAVEAADQIVKGVQGMTAGACDALSLRANAVAQRITSDARKRQQDYDVETRHGLTQIIQAGQRRAR